VLGIDEFGVLLDELPVIEHSAQGSYPTPGQTVVFVHVGSDAVAVPQLVCATQPCDPATDDGNARARSCMSAGQGVGTGGSRQWESRH
jgi:hypothetical protein